VTEKSVTALAMPQKNNAIQTIFANILSAVFVSPIQLSKKKQVAKTESKERDVEQTEDR
jgi:hypothetical protein